MHTIPFRVHRRFGLSIYMHCWAKTPHPLASRAGALVIYVEK